MRFKLLFIALLFSCFSFGQIISQYVETDAGPTPKGIEIWNNTGTTLNFATNNLVIQQGTNGGAPTTVVTVNSGTLAPGDVMVIGTSDIGTYLTGQGLTGVTFVAYTFTFNGDDSLVVIYGGTTTDTFGNPGSDPGAAWTGSGVSTANQNLQINNGIGVGSAAFTDPSIQFSTISTTPSTLPAGLSGFGISPPPLCTSPSTQASLFTSSLVTSTTATIGLTRGNGNRVLIVGRAGGAVNQDPASGSSYTASTVFGSGSQIGTGNFVVYDGVALPTVSVALTNLVGATTYHFAAYEYNTTGTCYNLVELTGTFTTPAATPVAVIANNGTQVTAAFVDQGTTAHILHKFQIGVTAANTTLAGMTMTTTGNYTASDVVNFKVRYSADNVLDVADVTLATETSIASGSGESVTFSLFTSQIINAGTTGYVFITADFSATAGVGRTISVNAFPTTATNLTFLPSGTLKSSTTTVGGVQTIRPSAPAVPTSFTEGCTGNTSQVLSWSAPATGTFDGYMLVVREGAGPHAVTAINASTASPNLNYTLAPTFGSTVPLSRILYVGTGTSVTVTGLTPGINYVYELYAYKNNGASPSVYSSAPSTSQIAGLANVSSAITNPLNASGTVSWINPNALCYNQVLVVVTAAPGITFAPTGDGSAYTANTVFSGFNQVVYASSGNNLNITGLTNGVTYYIEIFIRNGTEWSSGVEVSVTPINIVPTVLNTGDLLLIAYDNAFAATADDSIRLVSMVDITQGTSFLWANATYETGGNPAANVRTDKWYTCNGVANDGNVSYLQFTYTGSAIIPAGSIFCIRTVVTGTSSTISAVSPSGVSFTSFSVVGKTADGANLLSHNSVNVSTSAPDAMFLMQGVFNYNATGSTFTGNVLSSIQDGASWYDLGDNLTAATGNALRISRKHPSLLCASIQANPTPASYEVSYNVSSSTYTTGNKPYLLGSILNYGSNWIGSFGTCPSASPFVILASDPFNRWTGSSSTNWFDCSNWSLLTVPDETTDVLISSTAINDSHIVYTSPFSDGYSDIAKCKDLTISGRRLFLTANPLNKLEVHGNLLINTTGILQMDDGSGSTLDGQLYLYGDWTNSLTTTAFNEGNGTVHFVGSSPQVINNNVHANVETFGSVVLNNDFNTFNSNNLRTRDNLQLSLNKKLTIASNDFVTAGIKFTNNGIVEIANHGQFIQDLDTDTNDGDYSGSKFEVERIAQVKTTDYVYWSAPTENVPVTSLPNGNHFEWDTLHENTNNGTFGNWVAPTTTNMTRGKGYIARAFNGSATVQPMTKFFYGKPHNGAMTLPIQRGTFDGLDYDAEPGNLNNVLTTKYDDNWNLVGNPYPSAIDAEEFLVLNQTKIEGSIWIWKHGIDPTSLIDPFYGNFIYNYSSNDYIKYNGLGSTEPDTYPQGIIASGQGFMVNMLHTAATPNTLAFNNSLRTGTASSPYNNSFFFRSANNETSVVQAQEKHRIWLDIINSTTGQMDRMLVGYSTNSTMERDHLYDCIYVPRAEVSLFSLIDDEPFIIQGRSLPFTDSDLVPLGARIVMSGNHTIAIKKVDGLFADNQNIYLEDKLLGIIHDLKQAPYNFTSEAGVFKNRFVLRYTNQVLSTTSFNAVQNVIVSSQNNQISVKSAIENIDSVTVYDVLGREIVSQKYTTSKEIILNNINATNQALVIKITLENGTVVTRKVIL
jgi:hypothetical protein